MRDEESDLGGLEGNSQGGGDGTCAGFRSGFGIQLAENGNGTAKNRVFGYLGSGGGRAICDGFACLCTLGRHARGGGGSICLRSGYGMGVCLPGFHFERGY